MNADLNYLNTEYARNKMIDSYDREVKESANYAKIARRDFERRIYQECDAEDRKEEKWQKREKK